MLRHNSDTDLEVRRFLLFTLRRFTVREYIRIELRPFLDGHAATWR